MKRIILLLGAMVLVAAVPVAIPSGGDESTAPEAAEETNSDEENEASVQPVDQSECPTRFVQSDYQDFDNDLNRVVVDGLSGTPEEQIDQLLVRMGQDARVLSLYAAAFFDDAPQWETLVDDGCLNESGRDLYHQVEGVIRAATLSEGEAPADGRNSGMTPDGPTVSETAGISGDRSAVVLAVEDKTFYVLSRCANPVFKRPPKDIPPGPTDEPPAEEPPTEEPPTEEPPTEEPPTEEPPTEEPPTEEPPTEEPERKDPDEDVLTNPDVPEEVTGPGTTPPGGDPGEPDDPADHDRTDPDIADDGCRGDCEDPGPIEADPDRDPGTDGPPEPDEPQEEGNLESCGPDGDQSCGYEQPDSSDGSPEPDDSSSGGGEDGVIDEPDESAEDNPEHDGSEPSPGTEEDTSDVDTDTDASQDEDESNDEHGENPFTGMIWPFGALALFGEAVFLRRRLKKGANTDSDLGLSL